MDNGLDIISTVEILMGIAMHKSYFVVNLLSATN